MKLLYELAGADKDAFEGARGPAETILYCLPYNFEGDVYTDGFVVITQSALYRISGGVLHARYELADMEEFSTEVMFGSCGFYAKVNGHSELLCRFMSGRHLPRYTLMVRACRLLAEARRAESEPGAPLTNDEPEHFCPKCGRPYMENTQICPFCRDKRTAFKRLWGMTRGMRLMLSFPLLAAVVSLVIQFVVPILQKNAINNYIAPAQGTAAGAIAGFIGIVAAIVTMDLVQRLLSVIQTRTSAVSGNRFMLILRTVLYEKIQTLSISSIQRKSTGDLMGRVTDDVTQIQTFMTGTLPSVFVQIFSFIIALVVLLCMNPFICLFVFVPIPVIFLFVNRYWGKLKYFSARLWKRTYAVNCLLQDTFSGERIVKSFGREASEISRFNEATDLRTEQGVSNNKKTITFFDILAFVLKIGTYLILFYGNVRVFRGEMTLGELYQYTAYIAVIYAPLTTFVRLPDTLSTMINAVTKVFEILDEDPEVSDIKLPIDITIEGDIDVKNVTFGYNTFDPVLENINFSIHQGEMIGIVGASGSGKSTLINLIMRLYDVDAGAIEIDNVNIKDISQRALRSQMGVVLQETHLFYGTVRDNIRYAKPFAEDEEVIAAARMANAHDFICNLPQGYNTMIGERGFSLSGGERQRIAIARAMIHDPRIIILDEATAALDTETEKMIQDSLNTLMRGRTTIAIAHRLSTLRNADRLVVLDRGHLAEIGTHSELLKKKGIYYKLVMAQRLGAVK